jgi:hypothetical protein
VLIASSNPELCASLDTPTQTLNSFVQSRLEGSSSSEVNVFAVAIIPNELPSAGEQFSSSNPNNLLIGFAASGGQGLQAIAFNNGGIEATLEVDSLSGDFFSGNFSSALEVVFDSANNQQDLIPPVSFGWDWSNATSCDILSNNLKILAGLP